MIPLAVLERASRAARNWRDWVRVYADPDEPGGYGLESEGSGEEWYQGQEAVAVFGPDGVRQG